MRKFNFLFFVTLMLLLGVSNALTIKEPRNNLNYYTNLIDFDVSWDSGTNKCQYALNNQTNKTFGCQNTFIIDIPYHSGRVNITLYGTDSFDAVSDNTTSFILVDDNNTITGIVGVGVLFLAIVVSLIMLLIAFMLCYIEQEPNEHWALKIVFMLLSFVMLFPAYNVANILIMMYIHNDSLVEVMSPFTYVWLFITLIFIIFIYIIYKVFMLFESRKHKTGDYDD